MSLLKSNEGMSTFQTRWIGQQAKQNEKFAGISCLKRLMILNPGLTFNPGFRVFDIINKMNYIGDMAPLRVNSCMVVSSSAGHGSYSEPSYVSGKVYWKIQTMEPKKEYTRRNRGTF